MDTLTSMISVSRKWYPHSWKTQREDIVQSCHVALLTWQGDGSAGSWKTHLGRALRTYFQPLTVGWHKRAGYDLGDAATKAFTALGTVQAAARSLGVNHGTMARQLSNLPPAAERMKLGGQRGCEKRWPGVQDRRAKARAMRAAGWPLWAIQAGCGYRSIAAAHYAVKGAA